jgi:hypothetical protein
VYGSGSRSCPVAGVVNSDPASGELVSQSFSEYRN